MNIWPLVFIISTLAAAAGFVVVAIFWLKRLRHTIAIALGESANQQIRSTQRMGEALAQLQRKQQFYEQRLQTLTEANIHMRQELNLLAGKVEIMGDEDRCTSHTTSTRIIH
jgi:predicted nucleic acid-binding protein